MDITLSDTIILSLIQGITEFLPISSSGHLVLAPVFFGFDDPGLAFSAGLHFGTLGAVVVYFWRDLVEIIKSLFGVQTVTGKLSDDAPLPRTAALFLVVATMPAAAAGFFFEDIIAHVLRAPEIVVGLIVVTSVLLWRVDRYKRQSAKSLANLTLKDAVWFGVLQAVAVVPGVSRSGATILTGRALGFSRHAATRFSFLMAIPIIFGASLLELPDVAAHGLTVALGIGMGIAFVAAYATIAFFLRYIERVPFSLFVWYSAGLLIVTLRFIGS